MTGKDGKKAVQPSSGAPADHLWVRLRLDKWSVAAAAAVLVLASLFFGWEVFLYQRAEEPELTPGEFAWYGVGYWALSLVTAFVCLLQVRLPVWPARAMSWVLLLLLPLGAFVAVDLINSTRILSFSLEKILANYLCYLMVFALLYAISRRVWVTALAGGLIFLIFGIANYFVVQFRGQPILPWDIQGFGTALTVSGGYTYEPTPMMTIAAIAFLLAVALCVKIDPREKPAKSFRMAERGVSLGLAVVLFVLLFPMNILAGMGISVWAWNQKTSSEITGITAGFFANVQFLMVDKPEGYSTAQAEEVSEVASQLEEPEPVGEPEKLPTVIAIMNESFTDMERTGDGSITLSQDNLPFLHSLEESGEVVWGTAYSSVYGGNTCNSEYEFLTGNTTAFLPAGSKPYQQYVDHDQTSLVSLLKDTYGYECKAIHPGNRSAWQRDTAYEYLGFDEFIDVSEFDVTRRLEHGLTSDRSSYDQVIYEYEHRDEDTPLFLFNVTIQNHGGYEDEDYKTTVEIEEAPGEYPQAEQYLSLTKKSDEALEYLIDYFSQQEDPVVILFFGDHWPNLESEFLTQLLGENSDSLSFENIMREYEVPFMIWANYDLEGEEVEAVSLNYLSGLLLRAAGLEGTSYTNYLENLRKTLPVITAVGVMDSEGNWYRSGEKTPYDDLLNEYNILEYNNAFGGDNKCMETFTLQVGSR
ncbi:MAG: sulfatase-like hydrolase/transferase [Acutalibacter sp.]